MSRPQSEAPDLHLERARDRVGGSRTTQCADYWRGERPVQGWWWRGGHRSQISLQNRPKCTKKAKKRAVLRTFWLINCQKCMFFTQKYLTRYTHETFFEEYMNFETHYLSHYRVIPLQSFGSHKRPQLHGLGLTYRGEKYEQHSSIFSIYSMNNQDKCSNKVKVKNTYLRWQPLVQGCQLHSTPVPCCELTILHPQAPLWLQLFLHMWHFQQAKDDIETLISSHVQNSSNIYSQTMYIIYVKLKNYGKVLQDRYCIR